MNHNDSPFNDTLHELLTEMADRNLTDSADLRIRTVLNKAHITASDSPSIMNLEQAAAYLNIAMNEMIHILDDLPSFEIAGTIRFRRAQLKQWIETREQTLGWQKNRSTLKQPIRKFKIAGG